MAELISVIACSECKHIITQEIYQCKSGHIYCELCIRQLQKCKVCQVALDIRIRARATEHVRDLFDISCPNPSCNMRLTKDHKAQCKFNDCVDKCGFKGTEDEVIMHKELCRFKTMNCIYSSACKQSLSRIDTVEHIRLEHKIIPTTTLLDEIIILEPAHHILLLPNGDIVVVKLDQSKTSLIVDIKSFITQFYRSSIKIYNGKDFIDKVSHNLTIRFEVPSVVLPGELICAMKITKLKI